MKDDKRIVNVKSPLNNEQFVSSTYHFFHHGQHSLGDKEYLTFLDHIRHWQPEQTFLDEFQREMFICVDGQMCEEKIMAQFMQSENVTLFDIFQQCCKLLKYFNSEVDFCSR